MRPSLVLSYYDPSLSFFVSLTNYKHYLIAFMSGMFVGHPEALIDWASFVDRQYEYSDNSGLSLKSTLQDQI